MAPEQGREAPHRLVELQEALALWMQCHAGLWQGYLAHIGIPVQNSAEIRRMFGHLDPLFQQRHAGARNGAEALEKMKERVHDILLMDIAKPQALQKKRTNYCL